MKGTLAPSGSATPSFTLTYKQQAFVREYIKDCNGTQAAIRAGYSPRTANEQASRLLAKVSVKAAVERAIGLSVEDAQGVAARLSLKAVETLQDLMETAPRQRDRLRALEIILKIGLGPPEKASRATLVRARGSVPVGT